MDGINHLPSKSGEARLLFKKCFRNKMFVLVPFEIWRDILGSADLRTVSLAAQTCWGFKELIDNLREMLLKAAKQCRLEGNMEKALNLLERSAEAGSAIAMVHIGCGRLSGGWGVRRDTQVAFGWFEKAAARGNGVAMARCAYLVRNLELVGVTSSEWARKALESKDVFGEAYCHYWGLGVSQDNAKALALFQSLADQGDEYGQNWLGMFYSSGFGVDRNTEKAFYWFSKSADQGLAYSQFDVSCLLRYGDGCEKDEEKANVWLRKAAAQNFEEALTELELQKSLEILK